MRVFLWAMCTVLDFEKSMSLTSLTSYLMENKAPLSKDKTYFEYLNRVVVTKEKVQEIKNAELAAQLGSIDTGISHAVLFVEGVDVNPASLTGAPSIPSAVVGGGVGAIGGGLVLLGTGLCGTIVGCTAGAVFIAVGAGTVAFLAGSTYDPDLDSRVLLWPYTNTALGALQCTVLEGQDQLEIRP
jgi:hypothetical protein